MLFLVTILVRYGVLPLTTYDAKNSDVVCCLLCTTFSNAGSRSLRRK